MVMISIEYHFGADKLVQKSCARATALTLTKRKTIILLSRISDLYVFCVQIF